MINNSKEYLRQFEVQDHETISIEEAMLLNNERYKKSNDPMDLVFVRPTPPVKKTKAPKVSPIDLAKSAQITALSSFYSGKYGSLTLSEFLKDMQINDDLPALSVGSKSISNEELTGQLLFVVSEFVRAGHDLMSSVDDEEESYIAYDEFNEVVLNARALLLKHGGDGND